MAGVAPWLRTWSCFANVRCYRVTPKRLLYLAFIFTLNTTLWCWWITKPTPFQPFSWSFIGTLQPRAPLPLLPPLPLPLPLPQLPLRKMPKVCSEFLDQKSINATRLELLKNISLASNPDPVGRLKNLLQDCSALINQHRYLRWPVTPQEQNFPLAFGFKVHDAPDMFERLLRVIWRPQNLYVIHVDGKTPNDTFKVFQDLSGCFDNVQLAGTRIKVVYASVLSLYADIECVKTALKSPIPWKYYLGVSGHEFPLKTNLEIVQILTFLNGTNDIENYHPAGVFSRMLNFSSLIKGKVNVMTQKRRLPFKHKEVELRKGSAYFAAVRKFLEWVLLDKVCEDFLGWVNETWAADEMFWATANYLPGAPGGIRVDVRHDDETFLSRAVAWHWDKYKCQGRYVRKVCVFVSKDLPWLLKRPELIANKFSTELDPLVLDCLEGFLEEKAERGFLETKAAGFGVQSPPPPPPLSFLNWTYYKALPHVRALKPV